MNLLHPASPGSPVGLWFVDGVPVRLVHEGRRFRVVEPACLVADPASGEDHWVFRATDETARASLFEVREDGHNWELVRAR